VLAHVVGPSGVQSLLKSIVVTNAVDKAMGVKWHTKSSIPTKGNHPAQFCRASFLV